MKVLVVGSGGREHALVWKIAQSPRVAEVSCLPGNAGIAQLARLIPGKAEDVAYLLTVARAERPDLIVIGPEGPLAAGASDALTESGFKVYGPTRRAAEVETSKAWCKEFMVRHGIPTAAAEIFDDAVAAHGYVESVGAPLVVKASGLAAGKGAIVCATAGEAHEAISSIMEAKTFGEAGRTVVIEEYLEGDEVSILAFAAGDRYVPMVPSQDHKRVFDGDRGPNTGGMGAYSPVPSYTPEIAERVQREIFGRALPALVAEGRPYVGVLYAGLMLTRQGPKVIEFNARMGDPETQVVLPRLDSDLVDIMEASITGSLRPGMVSWSPRAAATVVMASGGYPGKYHTGLPIHGLEETSTLDSVLVFHAGTAFDAAAPGKAGGGAAPVKTSGGRVLAVTALAGDLRGAVARAYAAVSKIRFEGAHYRKDIAARAIGRLGT